MVRNKNFDKTSIVILLLVSCAFVTCNAHLALAVTATTLGDIMQNICMNGHSFGTAAQWFAYVAGAAAVVQGIYHFRGHTESPQNFPLHRAVLLWVGGALLLSAPSVMNAVITTIYPTQGSGGGLMCSTGGPGGTAAASLDLMLANFITNIQSPLVSLVSIIAIVSGLFMFVKGLMKASKYGFDPKTHSIQSILTHITFGALLITIGDNLDMMVNSVFGVSGIASALTWTNLGVFLGTSVSTQFITAVNAGLTFVQLIGVIAFVRGWMVMKKVVEGGGNVTMAQGITHIIGGVLAININGFLVIMDSTFGTNLIN